MSALRNYTGEAVSSRNVGMIARDVLDRQYRRAAAGRWAVDRDRFAAALQASVDRAPAAVGSPRDVARYLDGLHVADLALACACAAGHPGAWEHFVREYRPALFRSADALDRTGGARDLADSLYAELF